MSEAIDSIEVHASKVGSWLACPARERFKQKNKAKAIVPENHVGQVIGDLVHAKVTGHEHEMPKTITFDSKTPSLSEALRQADRMADLVLTWIGREKIEVVGSEIKLFCESEYNKVRVKVFGGIDLLCKKDEDLFIIDLKTGVSKPADVFIQLAMYCYLVRYSKKINAVSKAAVLWVSRKQSPQIGAYDEKSEESLFPVALAAIKNLVLYKIADTYPYSPSLLTCLRCPHKHCPARLSDA